MGSGRSLPWRPRASWGQTVPEGGLPVPTRPVRHQPVRPANRPGPGGALHDHQRPGGQPALVRQGRKHPRHLGARHRVRRVGKHDVIPVVFEDRLEKNLPIGRGLLRFRSAEGRQEMVLSLSPYRRKAFEALVAQRKANLRDFFYRLGMECLFLDVAEPFFDRLMMLFERRRKV